MEKQLLRKKLNEYEGKIEHMYKDTKGFVTVGVGHLLKDLSAAQKLNFIHQATEKKQQKMKLKLILNQSRNPLLAYLLHFIKSIQNLNLHP